MAKDKKIINLEDIYIQKTEDEIYAETLEFIKSNRKLITAIQMAHDEFDRNRLLYLLTEIVTITRLEQEHRTTEYLMNAMDNLLFTMPEQYKEKLGADRIADITNFMEQNAETKGDKLEKARAAQRKKKKEDSTED